MNRKYVSAKILRTWYNEMTCIQIKAMWNSEFARSLIKYLKYMLHNRLRSAFNCKDPNFFYQSL